MIVGLGIDLVETRRVATELGREPWQGANGVFTAAEIGYCTAGRQPEERYATCFAAKEATLKALGTGAADLGMFREVELAFGKGTGCEIVLHDRLRAIASQLGARQINLSIAVARKCIGAMVVLES